MLYGKEGHLIKLASGEAFIYLEVISFLTSNSWILEIIKYHLRPFFQAKISLIMSRKQPSFLLVTIRGGMFAEICQVVKLMPLLGKEMDCEGESQLML